MEQLISRLNEDQKKAVLWSGKKRDALLVLAGAGSGKTSVLTTRIIHCIRNTKTPPEKILALTFTEAAAREMEERVLVHLGPEESKPTICTFHSLALKIIRSKIQGRYGWELLGYVQNPEVVVSEEKNRKGTREPSIQKGEVQESIVQKRYPTRATRDNIQSDSLLPPSQISFDEFVEKALELVRDYPEFKKHFSHKWSQILVDEVQDTSPDQLELLDALQMGGANLFLVGDDDQAIYGFRGAAPEVIGGLLQRNPRPDLLILGKNYRSTASILTYSNTIFRNKTGATRKILTPGRVGNHPLFTGNQGVKVHRFSTGLEEVDFIRAEILRLKTQYNLKAEDFCILYRLNAQGVYYKKALELKEKIPSGINFMTVHGSKGLEFPIVFLVGMEEGIFPHIARGEKISPARVEEEKRLFYVGVTRAESLLYITSAGKRMHRGKYKYRTPSRFVVYSGNRWQRTKNILGTLVEKLH